MKTALFLLIGIILMMMEASLASFFRIEVFKPDIGIPFVIYIAIFSGPLPGLVTSLLIGLFQEVLSNSPYGSMIFTKISIFLLATFLKNNLYIDSKYSFSFVCGGFVIVESFLFLVLSVLSKGETGNFVNVTFYMVPNAIFTGFVSIFVFLLMGHLNTKVFHSE